jgi:sensor histidine kinase regulating citrate/malate metabolism
MQRVTQFWQRLAWRERFLVSIVLMLFVVMVLFLGIARPYRAYTKRLEEQILQQSETIAKMVRVRDRAPQAEQQVTHLRQQMQASQERCVPGETPALAASRLQERLQHIASTSGLDVLSTVALRDEAVGDFRKTTVQMTLRGDLPAIAKFVAGVEYDDWLLTVSSLEVRGAYSLRMAQQPGQGAVKAPPLTVTLEVGGVMQGTGA